jgi:hypothetical protein
VTPDEVDYAANPQYTFVGSEFTVASSKSPSLSDDSVTFTATWGPRILYSTPGDTMEFFDNGTSLGTVSVDWTTTTDSYGNVWSTGTGTMTVDGMDLGDHNIEARYYVGGGYQSAFLDQPVVSAPSITSASSTTFAVGTSGSFDFTTSGFPTATILTADGDLPDGVDLVNNDDGTMTLSGTPTGGAGVYPLTITAINYGTDSGLSETTQSFTLTVNGAPTFTSDDFAEFAEGTSGSFTVTTDAYPIPTFSLSGSLPSGMTFTDNGDGTATISGTPATGSSDLYSFTITASNSVGAGSQAFELGVDGPARVTSANHAAFQVGASGSFTVAAGGFFTPAISESGALPDGLTFVDNGDGTATISGTATTSGTATLTLTADNGIGSAANQTFTITVYTVPTFTSGTTAGFIVGASGSFTVSTSGFPTVTTLSESGSLPSGLAWHDNGDGTATVSGTPDSTWWTVGSYSVTITADDGVGGTATQTLNVRVYGIGATGSIADQTNYTGDIISLATAGKFVGLTPGFSSSGLPTGLTIDSVSGVISTTPTAAGTYTVTVTGTVGSDSATQTFQWTIKNDVLLIAMLNNQTSYVGDTVSYSTAAFSGDNLTYSAMGAVFPSGLALDTSTGLLSGTLTNAGAVAVTIIATDGTRSATGSFTWTVKDDVTAVGSIADQSNVVGEPTSFCVSSAFTGDNLSYSANTLPPGVVLDANTGNLTGTCNTAGTTSVTVTATDGTRSATQTFNWTVT